MRLDSAVLTPRVAVSRGLLEGVSDDELRAVLEHERYHVCNLDPVPRRRATVSLVSAALFAAMFLASVFSFGGPAAVYRATGTGLSTVDLLSGLTCAAPFA